jgi:hypothetical protein
MILVYGAMLENFESQDAAMQYFNTSGKSSQIDPLIPA